MKRDIKETVLQQAAIVRAWAERANSRRKRPTVGLNGWCAIASAKLWKNLNDLGIKAELHLSSNWIGCHVFLVVNDHVVDITATQFYEYKRTPILIAHQRELEHHWFHQTVDFFETAEELRNHQIRTNWDARQIAKPT